MCVTAVPAPETVHAGLKQNTALTAEMELDESIPVPGDTQANEQNPSLPRAAPGPAHPHFP